MLTIDAHQIFADQQNAARVARWPEELRRAWYGVAVMCGYAMVSGWLDDAQDEADADEAAAHGIALVNAGVVSVDELQEAADAAIDDFAVWYEAECQAAQHEAELSRRAAAN